MLNLHAGPCTPAGGWTGQARASQASITGRCLSQSGSGLMLSQAPTGPPEPRSLPAHVSGTPTDPVGQLAGSWPLEAMPHQNPFLQASRTTSPRLCRPCLVLAEDSPNAIQRQWPGHEHRTGEPEAGSALCGLPPLTVHAVVLVGAAGSHAGLQDGTADTETPCTAPEQCNVQALAQESSPASLT